MTSTVRKPSSAQIRTQPRPPAWSSTLVTASLAASARSPARCGLSPACSAWRDTSSRSPARSLLIGQVALSPATLSGRGVNIGPSCPQSRTVVP